MWDDDECRCYFDHLLAEHRRLHSMLREMRAAIVNSTKPDGEASFAEVAQTLQRLHRELEHHFAQEEAGGCLDEAVSRCPRLSGEAKRVEAEHPDILAEVNGLIQLATSQEPNDESRLAIQKGFERLYQRLLSHEAAENRILAEGFGSQ